MTEEQKYLPEVIDLMKEVAIKKGGELVTPDVMKGYIWTLNKYKNYYYEIEYTFYRVYENENVFYFSNYLYNNKKRFSQEETVDWKKELLKIFGSSSKKIKFKDIKIDWDIVIKTDKGFPAIVDHSIKHYTGNSTFDTFRDLYNFAKL